MQEITTTGELNEINKGSEYPKRSELPVGIHRREHNQAIRIELNHELDVLRTTWMT